MPDKDKQSKPGQGQGGGGTDSGQGGQTTGSNPIGIEVITKGDKTPKKTYENKDR